MPPPNTRRVAGIGAEKWIARPAKIAVSPCPYTNKKNLNTGLFYALDCCTNKNITGDSRPEAAGCRPWPVGSC